MHKKALDCAKRTLEEFCLIPDPTCEQAELFKYVMCGYSEYINAEYKAKIIDAMNESEEEEKLMAKMGENMGYNNRRYASGRFAPAGRGHVSGYMPYLDTEDDIMQGYLHDPNFTANMRYGYTEPRMGGPAVPPIYGYDGMDNNHGMSNRYGRSFANYRNARRYYTETKSPEHKKNMESNAEEVFDDIETMALDVWKDMTPEEKTKYKAKWQQIMQKMM